MQRRLTLFSLALGAVMVVAPSLGNIGTDIAYDTALAAKGGNGKGNGGGNGGQSANGGGGGNRSASAAGSSAKGAKTKADKNMTAQMGALNAAHASANAFANPNPKSRVGRIKAAVLAQQTADLAAALTVGIDTVAMETTLTTALGDWQTMTPEQLDAAVLTAVEAANADPLADPALTAALEAAYANLQAVQAAAAAQDTANVAWDAAANKTVTPDVIQATMDLVGDKVPAPVAPVAPTTP